MPEVQGWKCDQCGHAALENRNGYVIDHFNHSGIHKPPEGWITIREEMKIHEPLRMLLGFCSWKCLAQYATGKHAVAQSLKEAPAHESDL